MIAVAVASRPRDAFALDVAFTVPAGGVTALLGPSGSGKTSVLRVIAGLDRRQATVRFGDEVWQDERVFVAPHRRHIGYVAQGLGLLPHLTVGANLDYAARRAEVGPRPKPFVRADIVARTGIGDLLHRLPAKLSGGEHQRASIARALLGQPRLLLMDEPLSGLDVAARSALLDAFEALFAAAALPVIYVTHDVAEAARLAHRTISLSGGRLTRPDQSSGDVVL